MLEGNYRGAANNPYNVSYKEKFGNVADSMSDYDRSLNDLSISKSVPQIWGIGGPKIHCIGEKVRARQF
jgi:hypothetical protein